MSDVETTSAAPAESGPDLNAIADRLFGKSSVTSAPAEQSTPVEAAKPAEATQAEAEAKPATETPAAGGDLPDAIRELRDDPLRRMFSPQGTYASVQLEESMKDVALDPAIKTAAATEFREIFADLGASPQDAHELVATASRFTAEPMTTERDASNTNTAIELLNQHFGNDAKSALADAQQMIARDPRLSRMLDQSRLGNDPQTVLKIAQLARSAKMRG
ncbi:hypothetical protein B0G81_6238 [Paraburkholderia sp. BL6665CI2N2]|uniref:hypothetical protein n=1 Tax=Paraburkholderia sp. BL6665CI2N2 TaxID=1938806 RepID=UPI0010653510|nr:hypothetical protein [Paraburkholderia sp. BL6665CI2N2]TDY25755.1 hypothetical protein B0G81_6238 [Paraburkholderia sp. BL6665CI2N2]